MGEGQEYDDPRKAVEAAINIAAAWRKTKPGRRVYIGYGYTGGFTMPFESCTNAAAREWAEKTWEKLEKCDRCGKLLPEKHYTDEFGDFEFCSEWCANAYQEDLDRSEQELRKEEEGDHR